MSDCNFWVERFSRLRSDKSPARWPAETLYRAPHKPLLLLSVLDLFAQGTYHTNLIPYHAELIDTFQLYWDKVMPGDTRTTWVLPYYHLWRDGFWHLIPVPGMEGALQSGGQIKTVRALEATVVGVRLDEDLYRLLRLPSCRDALRRVLIERYFAPELRGRLVEAGKIVSEAFQYSLELYQQAQRRFRVKEEGVGESYSQESRSTAFRKVVVAAYDHTCAACGLRLLTPEKRTAVEAAHIVPWSVSYNDDPRNGMALCGLHHWAFDEGVITVDPAFIIRVSPIVDYQSEGAQSMAALNGIQIVLPTDRTLHPAQPALKWHTDVKFIKSVPPHLF